MSGEQCENQLTMKYQKLTKNNLTEISLLKHKGLTNAFISRFAEAYYGIARSTVYRYISENRAWYNQSERQKRIDKIQSLMCQGFNSLQIAELMGESLPKINRIIANNKISYFKCQ